MTVKIAINELSDEVSDYIRIHDLPLELYYIEDSLAGFNQGVVIIRIELMDTEEGVNNRRVVDDLITRLRTIWTEEEIFYSSDSTRDTHVIEVVTGIPYSYENGEERPKIV